MSWRPRWRCRLRHAPVVAVFLGERRDEARSPPPPPQVEVGLPGDGALPLRRWPRRRARRGRRSRRACRPRSSPRRGPALRRFRRGRRVVGLGGESVSSQFSSPPSTTQRAAIEVGAAFVRVCGQVLGVGEEGDRAVGGRALEERGRASPVPKAPGCSSSRRTVCPRAVSRTYRRGGLDRGVLQEDARAVCGDRAADRGRARAELGRRPLRRLRAARCSRRSRRSAGWLDARSTAYSAPSPRIAFGVGFDSGTVELSTTWARSALAPLTCAAPEPRLRVAAEFGPRRHVGFRRDRGRAGIAAAGSR